MRHILIAGGGISGLRAAHIAHKNSRDRGVDVTLVDREPVFTYNPFACALRAPFSASSHKLGVPYSTALDGTQIRFVRAVIDRFERNDSGWCVVTSTGDNIPVDMLIIALGNQPRVGTLAGGKEHVFGVHSIHDAAQLRYHIESLFRRHAASPHTVAERALRVVIIGGGVTGVETAARIRNFQRALARRFRIDESVPSVVVCEAGKSILRDLPRSVQRKGYALLKRLGVSVRTGSPVNQATKDGVQIADYDIIPTRTTVWAGGMRAHDVLLRSALPLDHHNGLFVEETMRVRGEDRVFAAGSAARVVPRGWSVLVEENTARQFPDTVWSAIWTANVATENAFRFIAREPLISYHPDIRPYFPSPPFAGFATGLHGGRAVDLWALSSVLPNMSAFRLWYQGATVQ